MSKTADKIVSRDQFVEMVHSWKEESKRVVFTNGCFDILHLGHVEYLEKARAFGDKMVIGLNSDESVAKLKGEGRPVNNQGARAGVLAALEVVDLITYFEEDTPYELIGSCIPNVLVKGEDYSEEEIVGADVVKENGGAVKTVPLTVGFSTSEIINRIENK